MFRRPNYTPTVTAAEYFGSCADVPRRRKDLRGTDGIVIRSVFPIRIMLTAPFLMVLLYFIFSFHQRIPWQLNAGVCLAAFVVPLSGYRLMASWRITLRESHVEFHSFGTAVRCPWELFDSDGDPLADDEWHRLVLPINGRLLNAVEKVRYERIVAQGGAVRSFQIRFHDDRRASIRGYYGLGLDEIAALLRTIAHSDGQDIVRVARPTPVVPPQPDLMHHSRWRVIDFTRMRPPAICCGCGCPDNLTWHEFRNRSLAGLLPETAVLEGAVPLPVCTYCWRRYRFFRGAIIIASLSVGVVFLIMAITSRPGTGYLVLAIVFLLGAPLVAQLLTLNAPAKVRRLSYGAGSAQIWTRHPNFFDDVSHNAPDSADR